MDAASLYDLLKTLSDAGREIATQQQGLADHGGAIVTISQQDLAVVKAFAEQPAAHATVWQGMPQACISLTDVTRWHKDLYCKNKLHSHDQCIY